MVRTMNHTIGENIRILRDLFELTQTELADIVGVTRESVGKWERNEMAIRDRHVARLVEVLGIQPEDIQSQIYGLARQYNDWVVLDLDYPAWKLAKHWKSLKPAYNGDLQGQMNAFKKYLSTIDVEALDFNSTKNIQIVSSSSATIPVVGKLHAGNPQDIEDVDRIMEVPTSVLEHHPKSYGWIVEGDCMDKVYPEGCMIVIDTAMEPRDGSIGAVRLDGYQEVMRRIHKGANTLILSPESWNPNHEDIVITKDSETVVEFLGTVVWFQASEEMD